MNVVNLIGNLGKDPEIINGKVAKFSIAINEKRNGENHTTWLNIVCFGKTAEFVEKYLSKGDKVGITGKLNVSQYEKDGITRYSTDIIANQIHFFGGGNKQHKQTKDTEESYEANNNSDDDDVPF